jgi:hypothetical protein
MMILGTMKVERRGGSSSQRDSGKAARKLSGCPLLSSGEPVGWRDARRAAGSLLSGAALHCGQKP